MSLGLGFLLFYMLYANSKQLIKNISNQKFDEFLALCFLNYLHSNSKQLKIIVSVIILNISNVPALVGVDNGTSRGPKSSQYIASSYCTVLPVIFI